MQTLFLSSPPDLGDEFLMRGDSHSLSKMLARFELYLQVLNRPGDIVEGGVGRGAGVLFWAKLIEMFAPNSRRRVVGFDTFNGFPQTERAQDNLSSQRVMLNTPWLSSPDQIMAVAAQQGLAHRIELIAGEATETIPAYSRAHPGFRVALLNIDFDTYAPSLVALHHLYSRLVPGGLVLLDEYGVREWGESDAADEFFASRSLQYHALVWATSPKAYVVKP